MKKNNVTFILIGILFFSLIIIMTYPLIFRITTHIPAFFSTDESYSVLWNSWLIKYSVSNNLPINKTYLITYPFGIVFYITKPVASIFFFINYLLSLLTNSVLTYNLQIFCNFFLMLVFTYLLIFNITQSRCSGLLSGITFAFSPYLFVHSWQHLGETYLWPIPLLLLLLFRLKDEYKLKEKVKFISIFILTTVNFNATYYSSVILIVFLIYIIKDWKEKGEYFRKIIFLILIALVMLIPEFLPIFKNVILNKQVAPSVFNIYHRPFEDLFSQSARALSYLLPSVTHPIFGRFTEQFIGSQLYGISFTEHTLYLGWVPLILAFVAFRRWRRNRKIQGQSPKSGDSPFVRENFYLGFFVFLAIVAWFFSQPPWWKIGPLKIYMPSFFMYNILPMFRAYCRFGIVVMLAVAVLAGFGLKFILERCKTQKVKIAVTSLFCGLVLFEFWNWPSYKVIDVSKVPEIYYWLKEQPADTIIAEYPLDADSPNEMYKLYQTKHEKKIINGTIPGTYANKITQTITKLSSLNTTGILKWMGVKYALVHRDRYLQTELIDDREELDKIPQNKDLKYIKSFPLQDCPNKDIMCVQKTGPIDIYEVIALPVKAEIEER